MNRNMSSLKDVKALLIDLSGTVHIGDRALDGAVEAVDQLKRAGFPFKFVTNTTKVRHSFRITPS